MNRVTFDCTSYGLDTIKPKSWADYINRKNLQGKAEPLLLLDYRITHSAQGHTNEVAGLYLPLYEVRRNLLPEEIRQRGTARIGTDDDETVALAGVLPDYEDVPIRQLLTWLEENGPEKAIFGRLTTRWPGQGDDALLGFVIPWAGFPYLGIKLDGFQSFSMPVLGAPLAYAA